MIGALMKWSPLAPLRSTRDEMDLLFDESFLRGPLFADSMTTPLVNVLETEKDVVVEVGVPGLEEKDIHIEATEDSVRINCEKKTEEKENHDGYYRREFAYGSFSRMIDLPAAVKGEDAKAELKQGVLRITLPKKEPSKPKAIPIPINGR